MPADTGTSRFGRRRWRRIYFDPLAVEWPFFVVDRIAGPMDRPVPGNAISTGLRVRADRTKRRVR
jgi:hypothetical protein